MNVSFPTPESVRDRWNEMIGADFFLTDPEAVRVAFKLLTPGRYDSPLSTPRRADRACSGR